MVVPYVEEPIDLEDEPTTVALEPPVMSTIPVMHDGKPALLMVHQHEPEERHVWLERLHQIQATHPDREARIFVGGMTSVVPFREIDLKKVG